MLALSRVLVTGASGFVGSHLCRRLVSQGYDVIGTRRDGHTAAADRGVTTRIIGDIGDDVDWDPILDSVDYIVHLAARVHVMRDEAKDPLEAFRRVNVGGTERLLSSSGMRGVKHVVFLSSIKVLGEQTTDHCFSSTDQPRPNDPYGQSKFEAEELVEKKGHEVGFRTTIIRPPLIYGAGVGGNFLRLMKMVDKGYPLPFGSVSNLRSLVGIENLCDLIGECLSNPSSSGRRFLVSDNKDVSTPDLVRHIARSMSRPARLLRLPQGLLGLVASVLAKSDEMSRLTGSLQVDISDTMRSLDWNPPVAFEDGIDAAVSWYMNRRSDD